MELWSRLCLLVLAATASTRGQTTADEKKEGGLTTKTTVTPRPLTSEAKSSAISSISSNISSTTNSDVFSASATVPPGVQISTTNESDTTIGPKSGNASSSATAVMVTTATDATSVPGTSEEKHWGLTAGYVVLVLIILVIIVLCFILICLRRASRTYSFDLQRPAPPNHVHLPTFEPIDLDDFEQTTPKVHQMTENLHPSVALNGMSQRMEGEGSSDGSHTSSEEQLAANVTEVLPNNNNNILPTSCNPTEQQPDQWSCTDLFFDAAGEGQQNEKTPSVCSSEPFVEVNLGEDAW